MDARLRWAGVHKYVHFSRTSAFAPVDFSRPTPAGIGLDVFRRIRQVSEVVCVAEETGSVLRWDDDVRNDAAAEAGVAAQAGQVSRAASANVDADVDVGRESRVARRQEVPCACPASSTPAAAAAVNGVGVVSDDAPRTDAGDAVQRNQLRAMSDAVWHHDVDDEWRRCLQRSTI